MPHEDGREHKPGNGGADGGDDGGDDGGGGGSIPLEALPKPIRTLATLSDFVETLKTFAKSPGTFIRTRVGEFLAGAVIGLSIDVGRFFGDGFDALVSSIDAVGDSAVAMFATPGAAALDILQGITQAAVSFGQSGGPLAWLIVIMVAVIFARLIVEISIRTIRGVLDAIPGLSGVETFIFK